MSQNQDACDCNDYRLQSANTGIAALSVANPNLNGTGTVVQVITGAANGTLIKSVIIKATMPVTTGMVRLLIANAGATAFSLYKEIPIPTSPVLNATPTLMD